MFQAVDLSSNFYFSYSYDLTHTLQYNYEDPKFIASSKINWSILLIFMSLRMLRTGNLTKVLT